MSKPLVRRPPVRRSVIDTAAPAPDIGRRLWEDEPGPVLVYAQLCTSDSVAAERLARQADGRLSRAAHQNAAGPEGLPTVPVALNAVLDAAVEWAGTSTGRPALSPVLVEWVKRGGTCSLRGQGASELPLAVRALCALDAPDSELFWWSRVEGLPDEVTAQRLDRPRPQIAEDVLRVTAEFRERARLSHTLQVQDPVCRSYAGLLDATARQSGGTTPADLLGHLDQCPRCSDAFRCLSVASPLLPQVVAGAALGWNGPVYVARRRRQLAQEPVGLPGWLPAHRSFPARPMGVPRIGRQAWAAGAAALLLLVLVPLLLRGDPAADDPPTATEPGEILSPGVPKAPGGPGTGQPGSSGPPGDPGTPGASSKPQSPPEPSAEHQPSPGQGGPDGEPPRDDESQPPACRAVFAPQDTWPDGVRAELEITTERAVGEGWVVTFRVPDDVSVETWYGVSEQQGNRVSVTAPDHDRGHRAGATFTIGVVLRGYAHGDAWVSDIRVDGRACGH
ncbi:cellulose binding domain-containing protein [Streptomyces sp. NPDC008343]|uniref:cellulose binding domain-containing protein n=1 Tax=Streptomyces sp. NPDC008343 TaxID=3364828 RepID=UPI0036EA4E66